jgi:hypothetical protein
MSNAAKERIVQDTDYIDYEPKNGYGAIGRKVIQLKRADEVKPINDYNFIMPKEERLRERQRARKAKHLIRQFREAHAA